MDTKPGNPKKRNLLDDDDVDPSEGLHVNREYADRFEHNKRREERQKRTW